MVSMINDLLDMEKLEAGAFELRYAKVSAQSIIRRSIDAIQPVAEKKAISFAITEADLDLVCDDERIIRVLVNLLHNAIKFSHTNATVTIALEGEQQFAKFIVRDEGRGIAASEIDCIFERFKQAGGDTNANKNSSGLGLAICRAIVEAHRGSIGVESVLDHGSNFWFRLPIDQPLPNL
jgi:signal transduction histidine kinase